MLPHILGNFERIVCDFARRAFANRAFRVHQMHQRLALYHARAAKEARHFSQGWWMHQNRHEKRAGEAGEKRVLRGGTRIKRQQLYRSLGPDGNPTLETMLKVLPALGLKMRIEAAA
jgi:hypothetical protein